MKRVVLAVVSIALMSAVQLVSVHAQAKPKTMSATGMVKSVSADSLAITSGGKEMTFTIDSSTKFVGKGLTTKSKGEPMKATDAVGANDDVSVLYQDMGGKMHASSVTVNRKAMKK